MAAVSFGLIGLGEWARTVHIPNLLRLDDARVAAIATRSEKNLEAGRAAVLQGQEIAPALYDDYHKLLADPNVDAVIVGTPNDTHEELAAAVLQSGKHVLCEKPLSFTLEGCRRVQAAAEKSGRVFQVGLELRYADVARRLLSLLRSGIIGSPRMARCLIWRDWGAPQGWRAGHDSSGGIYLELAVHYLDLLDYLVDDGPVNVFSAGGQCLGTEITDHLWTNLSYKSGVHVNLGICVFSPAENLIPLEFVGEKGRIAADIITGKVEVWLRDGSRRDESPPRPADYRFDGFPGSVESLAGFIHSVQTGTPPLAGIQAATRATALALAAETSERTRMAVAVEE